MSGFTNIAGIAPPTTLAGFAGLLQLASFRGVPFQVTGAVVKTGRRQAVHEYPFRDGGWPEDMGRSLRIYGFSGYLIGDLAPVMQLALATVLELKGPGILVHPTIGAVNVAVLSASSSVRKDRMRVIEVQFEFVEASGTVFPTALIATAVSVLLAAGSALGALNADLGGVAIPAAADGPAVTGAGAAVVSGFGRACTVGGTNPAGIIGMAVALPPPDANTTYGRYAAGSASTSFPAGATVATIQGQLANQRATLATAATGAVQTASAYSASSDMADALAAIVEAMRSAITDPASQVQALLSLAMFDFLNIAGGTIGIGAAIGVMTAAMAAICRRVALVSLARASAAYQPSSYDDAAALRIVLAAAFDVEITAAGDAGEDQSYMALKALRAAVIQDLTTRGASLPTVVTFSCPLPLPSLVIAQRLYKDASRSDEIAAEAQAIHPAFCGTSFAVLSR
jgi:prophage DNA circulation protein